ncbi:serine/threonine-protein kinase [Corallococcus exiguus]|uniref:Protein kinase n=1 Tax=Corallococcus exiguus TaxID=83462 RepID=A0A7X5BSU7_9BACT|nr:serine/threonine-protein kinase [Corallococcus exiguus]NBC44656.1 protein kinase [Corallococcus exiguus]TNV49742.1 serine/threonine protein kinase [Corallococcus exiguus]
MALQAGDVFGRYELVSWLGRGGMAETWRAQLVGDAGVTKPVLIKKVLPEYANDEAFISMFISEARISATLSHGNVAQVFDFGRVEGEYFLAMEFVDGQPLHRILKRALKSDLGALPVPVAVFIAMEMCRGLHYAHTRTSSSGQPLGIVHRDISPDNVLLGYEGQVKIVDFGIAKAQLIRGFKTAPGVVKGKYLFFSPEQARGEDVDARTDVWATGVVLYELLCGKLPVEGPPHVVMMRVGRGEIPAPSVLRPDLPKEINDIVMKALTPDREHRFESSHAFGDALAGFLYSNFPRFSAMTIAHLLRVLFRGDLAQEGREMSVPGSFLEELKAWRQQTLPEEPVTPRPSTERQTRRIRVATPPPVTETTQPRSIVASSGISRPLLYGLSAGGLLTVGACMWFLLDAHSPGPAVGAPPPTPIQQPFASPTQLGKKESQTNPPVAPPVAGADALSEVEASTVQEMTLYIRDSITEDKLDEALTTANNCIKMFPDNPRCRAALELVQSKQVGTRPPSPTGARSKGSIYLPTNINEVRSLVDRLNKEGRVREALEVAQACADRDPKVPECHLMLGVLYAKLNEPKKSEQHYGTFLTLTPAGYPRRDRVIEILSKSAP